MALYDQRVFRCRDSWWVAQVIGGVSQPRFGEIDPAEPFRAIRESVLFTCLTDREANSRSSTISVAKLNRLSHATICRLADQGHDWGSRFEMHPHNTPDEEHVAPPIVSDDEGLRWATKRGQTFVINESPEQRPSLDLVCLDDSALKTEIAFQDDNAIDQYLAAGREEKLRELILLVKGTYVDLPPPEGR